MSKDRFERKAYRRSPGRQYGYDYDPLRSSRSGSSQSGKLDTSMPGDRWPTRGENGSRAGLQLAQRPDPRRTRQLLRQSILAGKSRSAALHEVETEQQDDLMLPHNPLIRHRVTEDNENDYDEQDDSTLFRNRYRARNNRAAQPPIPEPEEYSESDEDLDEDGWSELNFVDPDAGYEDPLDRRLSYSETPSLRSPAPRPSTTSRRLPGDYRRGPRGDEQLEYDGEEDYDDYYEEDQPRSRRRRKKQGLTRRKLLVGLGAVAVGTVAAYELGPKIPQALNDVGTNLEHQIQDAYNRGLTAGAQAVRKEFITALGNLEGVSLQGAIDAAALLRLAYDAFVSPLVTLAATVAGDFLNVTLQALIIGRGWLARINQDNSTMAALQTVLQSWVKQAHELPKELQTITGADLDGAQAYLRGLQRKIQEEQAKLNNPSTPTTTPKPTSTPHR